MFLHDVTVSNFRIRSIVVDIITSLCGGDMSIYQGHSSVKKKTKNGSIHWVCSKSHSEKCQGVTTTDEVLIANPRNYRAHNHNASNVRVEAMKCRSKFRYTSQRNNAVGSSALRCKPFHLLPWSKLGPLIRLNAMFNIRMQDTGRRNQIRWTWSIYNSCGQLLGASIKYPFCSTTLGHKIPKECCCLLLTSSSNI